MRSAILTLLFVMSLISIGGHMRYIRHTATAVARALTKQVNRVEKWIAMATLGCAVMHEVCSSQIGHWIVYKMKATLQGNLYFRLSSLKMGSWECVSEKTHTNNIIPPKKQKQKTVVQRTDIDLPASNVYFINLHPKTGYNVDASSVVRQCNGVA